jgi:hypothetical protein
MSKHELHDHVQVQSQILVMNRSIYLYQTCQFYYAKMLIRDHMEIILLFI